MIAPKQNRLVRFAVYDHLKVSCAHMGFRVILSLVNTLSMAPFLGVLSRAAN